jgi:hypothetical protein
VGALHRDPCTCIVGGICSLGFMYHASRFMYSPLEHENKPLGCLSFQGNAVNMKVVEKKGIQERRDEEEIKKRLHIKEMRVWSEKHA